MALSASEQLLIEMINRARLDPEGEAALFGIDLNQGLSTGTLDGSSRQVLAPNQLLHSAAAAHSLWMLEADVFSHTGADGTTPRDRMSTSGYDFMEGSTSGENIAYRGSTGVIDPEALMEQYHHRDLFLSAGHRVNMLRDIFREVGVAQEVGVFQANGQAFNVGMVTENFALSGDDVFVTGVSYVDTNDDSFYSIGEGLAGVGVAVEGQTTQTQAAGGYAIRLAPANNVTVTFGAISVVLDLSDGNGKLDLVGSRDLLTSVDTVLLEAVGSLRALGIANIDLTGHAGADVLIGNAGDNVLDGGAGADTVRYDFARSQATVAQAADGAIVVTSAQGTDILRNIETVAFADSLIDLVALFGPNVEPWEAAGIAYNGASVVGGGNDDHLYAGGFAAGYAPQESAQMFRLYQAAFGRSPDVEGHRNWTQSIFESEQSLLTVSGKFVTSKEFQKTYGDLSTEAFVDLLYRNVLGREADAEGRINWISFLENPDNTRAQALHGFSESREFQNMTNIASDAFSQARMEANWSDDIFRLYTAALGRAPEKGGFDNWVSALAEGLDFGEAVAGFVGSKEFSNRYAEPDNEGFVDLLYYNVLGRAADVAGKQNWLNWMEQGNSRAAVVEAFAQSREFVNATTPDLKEWVQDQGLQDVVMGGGGSNILAGGALADMFVFHADHKSNNTVLDLEAWDVLRFEGFGYADAEAVLGHFDQSGDSVIFSDQGVNIIFAEIALDAISQDMIVV